MALAQQEGMDTFIQDLKYGFRSFRSKPIITVVALLALALGIGANTALFSILYGILWKPLPYQDPDRLVIVWERNFEREREWNVTSPANFMDWKDQNQVFTDIAAVTSGTVNLSEEGNPEEVSTQYVYPNFFSILGVQPLIGHNFSKEDGIDPNNRVVMLTHGLWKRRFGSDPNIAGKQIRISGKPATVAGVLPEHFQWFIKEGALIPKRPQLFIPFQIEDRKWTGRYLFGVARVKPGVSIDQAHAQMALLGKQLAAKHEYNIGWGVNVVALREQLAGDLRKPLWILSGAVGFVLLIACANVANLMLSRALSRSREMAVRVALGAKRSRLIRQLLTESVLLSVLGGTAGLFLALWGTRALALLGARAQIDFSNVELNLTVLLFAFVLSVITGILFGLVPAFAASKWELNDQLKEGSRGTAGHLGKLRGLLVVGEIAVAVVLLAGAGLLMQSFWKLTTTDPGFRANQILSFRVMLPRAKYPEDAQKISWFRTLNEQLQALPGAKSVGMTSFLPYGGQASGTSFAVVGRPTPLPGQEPSTRVFITDEGFFKTLQIPLIKGRLFDRVEMMEAKRVVLINKALADKYFPGEDPIGKQLVIEMRDPNPPTEIIGIVGDIRDQKLDTLAEPTIYWPHPELAYPFMSFVIRTDADPMKLAPLATSIVQRLDPEQPVADIRLFKDWLGDSTARAAFSMLLLAVLASVALVLALAGIYAVISHGVVQRTQEIGIRMALGASTRDVFTLVLKNGSQLILAGVLIGCALTLALTRLMKSMLYETSTTDPKILAAVIAVLVLTALAACWFPSRRASRLSPTVALRYE